MRQQLALFDACGNGNFAAYKQLFDASKYFNPQQQQFEYAIIRRQAGPHDARMSQPERHIYNGFTPLLYMCYSDMVEAFRQYFEFDEFEQFYNDFTITDNRINAIGIDRQCEFLLPRDSNYIHVLLLRNATRILDIFSDGPINMDLFVTSEMLKDLPLNRPDDFPPDFTTSGLIDQLLTSTSDRATALWKQQNGRGFTVYANAVLCANCGPSEIFGHGMHSFKVIRSVRAMCAGMTENVEGYANPWFLACFYGRIAVLKFWWVCMDVDMDPQKLGEMFQNEDAKAIMAVNIRDLLIKGLLSYKGELPLTAACDKKIDYVKFGTSSSQKQECKKLISDILEYCLQYIQILHTDKEYDGFRELWTNPPSCTITREDGSVQVVSYPEYNKYEKPRKMILREWFDCENVPFISQQLLKLRRTKEEEQTDFARQIYKNFMLIHYAILNDSIQVYKLIRFHEGTVFTNAGNDQGKYIIQRGNTMVEIPDGTTTLQFAVKLNAVEIVRFTLKEYQENQQEFPYSSQVDKNGNNILITACECNNEAGRLVFQCPQILDNEDLYLEKQDEYEGFNVFITCMLKNCLFGLEYLVKLMNIDDGVLNIKETLERQEKNAYSLTDKQKIVLMILAGKDILKDPENHPDFQVKSYANLLFNMALEYIINNRLFKTSIYKECGVDWKLLLETAIGEDVAREVIQKIDRQDNRNNIYFWGRKQKGVDAQTIQAKLDSHDEEMKEIIQTALDDYYIVGKYECQIIQDDNNMIEIKSEEGETKRDFDIDDVFEKKKEPEDHAWFDACKNGDLDQIRNLTMICAQSRDKRPTDLFEFTSQSEQPNYRGFTGLMYAIINNQAEAVQFLLPLEAHLGTTLPYTVPSYAYGEDHFMYLAKGSDIEKLSIVSGNDIVYQLVSEYFKQYQLHKLFKEEKDALLQSKSSLSIINNRRRPINIDDLKYDHRVFRYLIQYQKINLFIDQFQNILVDRFIPIIVEQMTYETNYKGMTRNNYDMALKFACQPTSDIIELDESYQHCGVIVRQASQQMIDQLVLKQRIHEFEEQVNRFYKETKAVENIETLTKQHLIIQTDQMSEEKLVLQERCILQEASLLAQELSYNRETYNFVEQDVLFDLWFNYCRENNLKQVREMGRRFLAAQDRRTTSLTKCVHYGATGLMYSAIYNAPDVFNYLFEHEWQIKVSTPILYMFEGQYYYLPKDSNILHFLVQLNDPAFFNIIGSMPQVSELFEQFNIYGMTPFFLMIQQKYCLKEYFVRFIVNCNDFYLRRAIELAVESHKIGDDASVSNVEFARLLNRFNKRSKGQETDELFGNYQPTRVSIETTYIYILKELQKKVADRANEDGTVAQEDLDAAFNEAEKELYRLKNEAVVYAFTKAEQFEHLRTMQPEQAGKQCKWEVILKNYYNNNDDVYNKKFQAFRAFNRYVQDGAVVDSEDKIIASNLLFDDQSYIKKVPEGAEGFIVVNEALTAWFNATNPELEEVKKFDAPSKLLATLEQTQVDLNDIYLPTFIGQVDERFNDAENGIYHGFTALMYAIVHDNLDAFKWLLIDKNMKEANVPLQYQNVCKVKIPNLEEKKEDQQQLENKEKYYLIQPGTPLLHLCLIFNATKILQAVSSIARKQEQNYSYSDNNPNEKIIGAIYQQWRSFNTLYLALQLERNICFPDLYQYLISRNFGENIISTSAVFKNLSFPFIISQKYGEYFQMIDNQLKCDQMMEKDDILYLDADQKANDTMYMTQRTAYDHQIDKRCLEELTYLILKSDDIKFDVIGPEFNVKDLDVDYNSLYRQAYHYAVQRAESNVFYQLLQTMSTNQKSWHVDSPDAVSNHMESVYTQYPQPEKPEMPGFKYINIVPKNPQFEDNEFYNYDNDIRAFKERKEQSEVLVDGTIYSVINSAYVIHDQKTFIRDFQRMQEIENEKIQQDMTLEEEITAQQEVLDNLNETEMLKQIEEAAVQFNLCGPDVVRSFKDALISGGLDSVPRYENCKLVGSYRDDVTQSGWPTELSCAEDQVRYDRMYQAHRNLLEAEEQIVEAKTKMRLLQEDAWFQACKMGDSKFVRENFDKFVGIRQRRDFNVQLYHFKGWTGLCYACYFNQLDVVKLLFDSEATLNTRYDTIVDAYAIGFGEMFLVSRDSTTLTLAVVNDNRAVVQWLLSKIEKATNLYDHYSRTNSRGQPNLFIVAITWRSSSGKLLFGSSLVQNAIQTANHQSRKNVINPLAVIQLTRSAFICSEFYKKMNVDTSFKLSAFSLVLKSNMQLLYKTIQEDSVGETDIARLFFRLIYQDAVTYALKNRTEIQWHNMLKQNLGHIRCKMVENVFETNGYIEVIERKKVENGREVNTLDFTGMTILLETQIRNSERARQALNAQAMNTDMTRMDSTQSGAVSTIKPTIDSHDSLTLSMLAQTQKIDVNGKDNVLVDDGQQQRSMTEMKVSRILETTGGVSVFRDEQGELYQTAGKYGEFVVKCPDNWKTLFYLFEAYLEGEK